MKEIDWAPIERKLEELFDGYSKLKLGKEENIIQDYLVRTLETITDLSDFFENTIKNAN